MDLELELDPAGKVVAHRVLGYEGDAAFVDAVEAVVHEWEVVVDPTWAILGVAPPPARVRLEFRLDGPGM